MSDYNPLHRVTNVNSEPCFGEPTRLHPEKVMFAGTSEQTGRIVAADIVAAEIDEGKLVYWMIPPEGAPAYEAWKATGLPLMLQTRTCDKCHKRVLFA